LSGDSGDGVGLAECVGGRAISGGNACVAGCGIEASAMTAVLGVVRAGTTGVAAATLPRLRRRRWRRRRFPAAAAVSAGAG
jgi:hypothetical protein